MFMKIKMEVFKQFLNDFYSGWEYGQQGYEMTADISTNYPNVVIRVYTSVDVGTEMSREVGEDAIRFVLLDKSCDKGFGKTRRVNRTSKIGENAATIWDRIMSRVDEIRPKDLVFCDKCGAVKVLREPKPNDNWKAFYGCLNYKNCKDKDKEPEKVPEPKQVAVAEPEKVAEVEEPKDTVFVTPPDEKLFTSTKEYKHLKYWKEFDEFNPIQSATLPYVEADVNIVIGAATSSGKTIAAELVMGYVLKEKMQKIIYLSPLKSLTEEKYNDWKKRFKGFQICILTGDYTLSKQRSYELKRADIIVMTSEMTDSRTRRMQTEKNEWLFDVGLIIVDETHIITTNRGHAVESGLMRFTALNPEARIVLLSATMPNVAELGQWLTTLNGKKSEVISSSWRPTELKWHFMLHGGKTYAEQKGIKMSMAVDVIEKKKKEKYLVFVHDKNTGRELVTLLNKQNIRAHFHNADLPLSDRLTIERSFEDKKAGERVLISTSTLAWGRNLPARNVVIVGVHRGLNEVDSLDIIQMAGRAGRYGIDPRGDVYFICPRSGEEVWKDRVKNPRDITSRFHDLGTLCFHILAEVQTGVIYDPATLLKWYERTFSHLQGDTLGMREAVELFDRLKKIEMIESDGHQTKLTGLGRTSAWLYYDPFDVYAWYSNFEKILRDHNYGGDKASLALSWAVGNIPSNDLGYEPRLGDDFTMYCNRIFQAGFFTKGYTRKNCFAAYLCLSGEDKPHKGIVASDIRSLVWDIDRISQALKLIDSQYAKWGCQDLFIALPYMVQYAVSQSMASLCVIKGVGGVRARRLWDLGIRSIDDFKNEADLAKTVLGGELYNQGLKSVRIRKIVKEQQE